mmetsp:Transcript_14273/g.33226  ORF Transcript_14273/g.33226 Transcript_14273/m.33226 type:complete len:682 (+) Transcript_14273:185-2230(+)|eukprot:CAMPEP_0197180450 /NCGR_PEP_ID=MMETSP1423-20130617/5060_1 /TAXON_ID=476441 /ORGANISM="Pseudo-nitzschia heimii, Strain UNC1101" /LENGTH=681 /DNA_ID=CAMNT_0042630531 /DNA_START=140 /DNA_END=2185 /DNA_ORIENTATION=+
MGLREIPALSTLCLRAVGNPKCKADETFAPTKTGKPSSASRLLRSFHDRPVLRSGESAVDHLRRHREAIDALTEDEKKDSVRVPTLELIPMKRTPAIGIGSGRRKQANDVDLNHPWIASYLPLCAGGNTDSEDEDSDDTGGEPEGSNNHSNRNKADSIPTNPQEQQLVTESGSCALDLLQSYVDTLVEMGRMDDNRLGLRFFAEYKTNIELQHKASLPIDGNNSNSEASADVAPSLPEAAPPAPAPLVDAPIPKKKKRKRSGGGAFSAAKKKKEAEARAAAEAKRQAAILAAVPKSRGSLSLHNCEVLAETTSNILNSRILEHIRALDLTGIQTLTDDRLRKVLESAGLQLERLSIKNCRRLTDLTVHNICATSPNLRALDCGGDYNIRPRTILDALDVKVTKRGRGVFTSQALVHLVELHAGGIGPTGGWTDDLLVDLFALRGWKALSIGFSPLLTFSGWKAALLSAEQKFQEEEERQHDGGEGQPPRSSSSNHKNMCHTLQSLAVAFCEQQLVDNAWLGLVGRHLPNLRALDVRGNHQLHSMTSWYDGRATISGSARVHPRQSLMVLARYSGISSNGIEETKRVYPLAAAPLRVVLESDGIGWGILRQEESNGGRGGYLGDHYRKRLAAARDAAQKKAAKPKAAATPAPADETTAATATVVNVVPPEDEGVVAEEAAAS